MEATRHAQPDDDETGRHSNTIEDARAAETGSETYDDNQDAQAPDDEKFHNGVDEDTHDEVDDCEENGDDDEVQYCEEDDDDDEYSRSEAAYEEFIAWAQSLADEYDGDENFVINFNAFKTSEDEEHDLIREELLGDAAAWAGSEYGGWYYED